MSFRRAGTPCRRSRTMHGTPCRRSRTMHGTPCRRSRTMHGTPCRHSQAAGNAMHVSPRCARSRSLVGLESGRVARGAMPLCQLGLQEISAAAPFVRVPACLQRMHAVVPPTCAPQTSSVWTAAQCQSSLARGCDQMHQLGPDAILPRNCPEKLVHLNHTRG
jgi:hypothetical protein